MKAQTVSEWIALPHRGFQTTAWSGSIFEVSMLHKGPGRPRGLIESHDARTPGLQQLFWRRNMARRLLEMRRYLHSFDVREGLEC